MVLPKTFTLNSGAEIPVIGLGTWKSGPGEVSNAVYHALKSGYRHIDCAAAYQNEKEVGAGLAKWIAEGGNRADVWITSKVWNTWHKRERVQVQLKQTLADLGVDYVDLLLIHWPVAFDDSTDEWFPLHPDGSRRFVYNVPLEDTWAGFEDAVAAGLAKNIGVSNFTISILERFLPNIKTIPAVNQVESHPYLPQKKLKAFCESKGIRLQAYSPLGSGAKGLVEEKAVLEVAEQKGVSPATVLLSWQVQRGVVPLPKSVTPSRIEGNLAIVELTEAEFAAVESIADDFSKRQRFISPPQRSVYDEDVFSKDLNIE